VLAYAEGIALSRVTLVYPADSGIVPAVHRIRNDEREVLVRTVPVGHHGLGFDVLQREARAVATSLIRAATESPTAARAA
jgi:hypothetical protein